MIKDIFTALFFIALTVLFYAFSIKINKKFKSAALNPILLAAIFIVLLLIIFEVPYSTYNKGGEIMVSVLGPIVVVLAIPLYKNRNDIMKNFLPIIGGATASIITSVGTVLLLCRLFKIDETRNHNTFIVI